MKDKEMNHEDERSEVFLEKVADDIRTIADHYGMKRQLAQLTEECCELSAEACHQIRDRGCTLDLAGEIVDVSIMLIQIIYLLDLPLEVYKKVMENKLERQLERIRKEGDKNGNKDMRQMQEGD